MGGDLNLKKSWHPVLLKNQRRVYEEEKKALDERKAIDKLRKEREEERELEELQKLQESSGGPGRLKRVEWMYQGSEGNGQRPADEMEAFLLGKRRVDVILKDQETKQLQKATEVSLEGNAINIRDAAVKSRNDPLAAIQASERRALEQVMNDPIKRRKLLESHGRGHSKDESRHHRRRRSYSRSRSPPRRRHHRSDSRSRSPPRRRHHRSDSTSRSPERRSHHRHHSDRERHRSRSPRRSDNDRYRARSPPRSERRRYRSQSPRRAEDFRRRSRSPPRFSNRSEENRRREPSTQQKEEERARKLAEMQANATELDTTRRERVEQADKLEEENRLRDEKLRERNKNGPISTFRQTQSSMDLGERYRRDTRGLIAMD
jgi:hypothetical protein